MAYSYYPLTFYKYSGCGNDFILIDDRSSDTPESIASHITHLCHRHEGIGADGVILIQNGRQGSDVSITIYNADGSYAELCGNGLRCVIRCLHEDLGLDRSNYTISTMAGVYNAKLCGDDVEVMLGDAAPILGPFRTPEAPSFPLYSVRIGVPHVVLICPDLEFIDVPTVGRQIRHSQQFQPEGTNVNFITLLDQHTLAIRTYERGVEAETLACGTGGAASAIVAALHYKLSSPIHVRTSAGAHLRYHFQNHQGQAKQITMRGEARRNFQGIYQLPIQIPQENKLKSLREASYALFS